MVGYGKFVIGAAFTCNVTSVKLSRRFREQSFGWEKVSRINGHAHKFIIHNIENLRARNEIVSDLAKSDNGLTTVGRWLAALGLVLFLHGCSPVPSCQASSNVDVSSASDDKLLEIVRNLETRVSSLWSAIGTVATPEKTGNANEDPAQHALVDEVYDVVARNFDDSRKRGFDLKEWQRVRDQIQTKNLSDPSSIHSAIREMLLKLKDPYSRFLSPDEFASMSKYDISGVGLNLGTLQELQEKTGLNPIDTSSEEPGAWVVGLIRDSAAYVAGVEQGDQLLTIDGTDLLGRSPFEVASLLQLPSDSGPNENEWFGVSKISKETSPLSLRVRKLNGAVVDVNLQRPQVAPTPSPVVSKFDLRTKTGYIKLASFNARAQREIYSAVDNLESLGASQLVLDLRGNRGGLVSEGIEVAKLFLEGTPVFSSHPRISRYHYSKSFFDIIFICR